MTRGLTILSQTFLAGHRLFSTSSLTSELRLADLTAPGAYAFGITAELSATSDYTAPHNWSAALHAAGFNGLRYHVRHDPRSDLVGIAWYGPAGGLRGPPAGYSREVPAELLLAAAPYGIRVAGDLPAEP